MDQVNTPFHPGELHAQAMAGAGDVAARIGNFIRDHMPEQHRLFYAGLPFLVVAAADAEGRAWVSILEGEEGFIHVPDPRRLEIDAHVDINDPLVTAFESGCDVGVLGINLATRRRNRLSGRLRCEDVGFSIEVKQTFGNCPRYILPRSAYRVAVDAKPAAMRSSALTVAEQAWISRADTLFVGTGHDMGEDLPSRGFDASHRGGAPGFVKVIDATHFQIPDYAGNKFFNTIGNLVANPRIGVVFVDFETGSLLHITGSATVDWAPQVSGDRDALRVIEVTVEAVVHRPAALSLRWAILPPQ